MAKKIYTVQFRQNFIETWRRSTATFLEHCERYGVSRQTGYDWLERVHLGGLEGLETRSSAPRHCPHATSNKVAEFVIAARKLHPTWGPRKLGPWISARHPNVELPAASTMGEILKRAGLVPPRKRRKRTPRYSEPFCAVEAPNDVWTADFKGQFHTRDGRLCYPLTLVDCYSRYLLRCDAYLAPDADSRASFEAAFVEFGLPRAIRTDNGTPFAVSRAPAALSTLSVWWIRLGIMPERITPASPWENGRHERMHRTMKEEATQPPQANRNVQQRVFNSFRHEFNHERPHEALGQKPPATAYSKSTRVYPRKLPELVYPDGYELRRVSNGGVIGWRNHRPFISNALNHEVVGLKQTSEATWEVYFGPIFLGTLSAERPDLGLIRVPD
jgi:transposase InsO family protein